jgi:hypothetical protein
MASSDRYFEVFLGTLRLNAKFDNFLKLLIFVMFSCSYSDCCYGLSRRQQGFKSPWGRHNDIKGLAVFTVFPFFSFGYRFGYQGFRNSIHEHFLPLVKVV